MFVHQHFACGDRRTTCQCWFSTMQTLGIIHGSSGLVARAFAFSTVLIFIYFMSLSLGLICSFCFCLLGCAYHVCVLVCASGMCVCSHGENRSQCWISSSIALSFWDRVSLHLELTNSATLTAQQASELLLVLPGQHWNYMHSLPYLAFYMSSGDSNSGLHA